MGHQNTHEGGRDFTASALIVHLDGNKPRLALHHHEGVGALLQFGGHIEGSESPWDTALRKAVTEGGYTHEQLEVWQPFGALPEIKDATIHPTPLCVNTYHIPSQEATHYHTDSAFAFTTHEPPAEGGTATSKIELFTADELEGLPFRTIPENVRDIGSHILRVVLLSPEWHPLPATSFMFSRRADSVPHQL